MSFGHSNWLGHASKVDYASLDTRLDGRLLYFTDRGEAAPMKASLVQPRVLRLRLLQYRDVGIGVLPEGEEILIRLAALGQIAGERMGAGQPELCQRVQHRPDPSSAATIENV